MRQLLVVTLFIVTLLIITPFALQAAPAQLSVTTQAKLEQVIAKADVKTANQLRSKLTSLRSSLEQDLTWDGTIKATRYQNEIDLIRIRKEIKSIDANKLSKLDSDVRAAKARYQPLFDSYTKLNQQIDMAKLVKIKPLNTALRTQADVMKVAVQLARKDIRNKEDTYKKAKAENAKTIKQLRSTLSSIEPIKVRIKAEQSRLNTSKQRFTSEWKVYQSAIQKNDAKSVLSSLTSLNSHATQNNEHKTTIYKHEKSISDIMLRVQARIP